MGGRGVGGGAGAMSSPMDILNSGCLLDIQAETSPELGVVQTGDINVGLVSR